MTGDFQDAQISYYKSIRYASSWMVISGMDGDFPPGGRSFRNVGKRRSRPIGGAILGIVGGCGGKGGG
jgi:hypothetical protein